MWYFIVSIPDLCHLPYLKEGATSRIPLASAQSKFVFLQKLPEYGNTISQLNTTLRVYRYKGGGGVLQIVWVAVAVVNMC